MYLAIILFAGFWLYSASEHSLFSDEAVLIYQAYGIKEVGRAAQWSPRREGFIFAYDKIDSSHIHPRGPQFAFTHRKVDNKLFLNTCSIDIRPYFDILKINKTPG